MSASTLESLPTPALLLDLDVLERNLEAMARRAERLGVALRPHFKTHKCAEIARRQIARSRSGGTVATLEEARYFVDHGIDDLTWAFPLILGRLAEAVELSERARLQVVIDSREALAPLLAIDRPLRVAIKIDCGYHRAGLLPEDDRLPELAARLERARQLDMAGLLTHSGHAYGIRSVREARKIAIEERDALLRAAERLTAAGLPRPRLSLGSTPAMCAAEDLGGIDEARPGNYALFDYTQVLLGSCGVRDCAATVLASVVSDSHGGAVIDAGALALSKDPGPAHLGCSTYGEIFDDYATGRLREDLRVGSVSQEHGKLTAAAAVGSRLRILPNHSCLTVAQFDEYVVVRGETPVDRWSIHRAR